MAYQTGFVDNTGSEGIAHWQMLDLIRRFATGYGTAAAPVKTGTGTGAMTAVDTHPATVTETWTIACTSIATPGAETWSVTGSVSGAQAAATTGVAYDNALLAFLISAGATAWAVGDQFTVATTIGAVPSAARWTTLRYLNPTPYTDPTVKRELILQGAGLSGTEQIFIGFRAYQDQSADYYNLTAAVFTGYVAANIFGAQPGFFEQSLCAHNQRIDYWLMANAQRIAFGLKIGSPAVYEVAYAGKFYPYATPGQYPYPMACIGTLPGGLPATRYSDTSATHTCGVKGNSNGYLRDVMGTWDKFACLPWTADYYASSNIRRDTGGYYSALKSVLFTGAPNNPGGTGNVWGELDGIRYISGFNNSSENTASISGVTHVVLGDVFRNGIGDYFLLELN